MSGRAAARWRLAALAVAGLGLALGAAAAGPVRGPIDRKEGVMKIEVDGMAVTVALAQPRIRRVQELEVQVTFTNVSRGPLRLNAQFLAFPTIVLKVRTAEGQPVNPGPPPMPPLDDGRSGRIVLAPQQSTQFVYHGAQWFAAPVPPGRYQVRFTYAEGSTPHGDWVGRVESDWLDVVLLP